MRGVPRGRLLPDIGRARPGHATRLPPVEPGRRPIPAVTHSVRVAIACHAGGRLPSQRLWWDAGEGQLWLGTVLLHEFKKSAPAVSLFLDAFEAAGWTTDSLPIPVPREPSE